MHYNFKADVERQNGKFVANVEVSGPGRSGTRHVVADDLAGILAAIQGVHDEMLKGVLAFNANSVGGATHHSEHLSRQAAPPAPAAATGKKGNGGKSGPKAKGKPKLASKTHKKAQAAKNKEAADLAEAVAKPTAPSKEAPRKFASE
jgi:hypothetical protein